MHNRYVIGERYKMGVAHYSIEYIMGLLFVAWPYARA